LKTALKTLSDSNAHRTLRLTGYSLGADLLGFDPERPMFKFDVVLKTKAWEMARHGTRPRGDEPHHFIKLFCPVTRRRGPIEAGIRG